MAMRVKQLPFKRAAADAMENLDDLAEQGTMNDKAYLSLSKRLKACYDADAQGKNEIMTETVVEMAAEAPHVLVYAPVCVDWFCPAFVRRLVLKKKETCGGDWEKQKNWIVELVEHFLAPFMDNPEPAMVSSAILLLLHAAPSVLGPATLKCLRESALKEFSAVEIFSAADDDGDFYSSMYTSMSLHPDNEWFDWLIEDLDPEYDTEFINDLRTLHEDASAQSGDSEAVGRRLVRTLENNMMEHMAGMGGLERV